MSSSNSSSSRPNTTATHVPAPLQAKTSAVQQNGSGSGMHANRPAAAPDDAIVQEIEQFREKLIEREKVALKQWRDRLEKYEKEVVDSRVAWRIEAEEQTALHRLSQRLLAEKNDAEKRIQNVCIVIDRELEYHSHRSCLTQELYSNTTTTTQVRQETLKLQSNEQPRRNSQCVMIFAISCVPNFCYV